MLTCQIVTVTERTLKRAHGCVIITDEIHGSGRRRRTCDERSGSNEAGMKRNGIETADTCRRRDIRQITPQTQKQTFMKMILANWMNSSQNLTFFCCIVTLIWIWGHCSVSWPSFDPSDRWPHMCLYNVLVHRGAYGQLGPSHVPNTHFSKITAHAPVIHRQIHKNLGGPDIDNTEQNCMSFKMLLASLFSCTFTIKPSNPKSVKWESDTSSLPNL